MCYTVSHVSVCSKQNKADKSSVLQSLPRQGSLGEGLDPAVDIQVQVAQLVAGYQASLQELMTQLLIHWKVRPPVFSNFLDLVPQYAIWLNLDWQY